MIGILVIAVAVFVIWTALSGKHLDVWKILTGKKVTVA